MHLNHKLSTLALALFAGVLGSCANDEVTVEYEDWVVGEWSMFGAGAQTTGVERFEFTEDGRVIHEMVYCNAGVQDVELEYSWRPHGPDEVIVYDESGGYVGFGANLEFRVKRDPTRCDRVLLTNDSNYDDVYGQIVLFAGRVCVAPIVECDMNGCPPCATSWCDGAPEACEP